ncbi:MAG: hypothetical protein LBB62_05575 [Proteiniphilum sp.]|jgi:hypothetical protein|nr:hypothetical protein [Proteiniphilum sp.]
MDKEIKQLLNQIIANQLVIYKILKNKQMTPDSWVIEMLKTEADKIHTVDARYSE